MGLIKCSDCGNGVSDVAPACPICGRPVRATTIEQTGKQAKVLMLLGPLAMVIGIVLVLVGLRYDQSLVAIAGSLLTALGLIVYVWGRFQKWWHHE